MPTNPAEARRASDAPAGQAEPQAAASVEPTARSAFAYPMGDQPRLPVTPALLADLLKRAARARRLPIMINVVGWLSCGPRADDFWPKTPQRLCNDGGFVAPTAGAGKLEGLRFLAP
jgi:hypothetical protein